MKAQVFIVLALTATIAFSLPDFFNCSNSCAANCTGDCETYLNVTDSCMLNNSTSDANCTSFQQNISAILIGYNASLAQYNQEVLSCYGSCQNKSSNVTEYVYYIQQVANCSNFTDYGNYSQCVNNATTNCSSNANCTTVLTNQTTCLSTYNTSSCMQLKNLISEFEYGYNASSAYFECFGSCSNEHLNTTAFQQFYNCTQNCLGACNGCQEYNCSDTCDSVGCCKKACNGCDKNCTADCVKNGCCIGQCEGCNTTSCNETCNDNGCCYNCTINNCSSDAKTCDFDCFNNSCCDFSCNAANCSETNCTQSCKQYGCCNSGYTLIASIAFVFLCLALLF